MLQDIDETNMGRLLFTKMAGFNRPRQLTYQAAYLVIL
jgi:hypothetical protein